MIIYITNLCHAGYIHKHTQNCPYHHPFVFTCFLEDDFVRFVENFEILDFSKYRKLHYNSSRVYDHRDVYSWDALNKLINIQTENTPVIEFENGVQISYPHIQYDSFDEKYETRLKRFLQIPDKEICFIFRVRSFMSKKAIDRFYNTKYNKIILFDGNVPFKDEYEENELTKILITCSEHDDLINELKEKNLL